VVSGQSVYEISINLSSDVPSGIWEMRNLRIFGVREKKIQMNGKVVFDVLPATGVVYPTSAEVSINLDQKQLLRTEAGRLQRRVEKFRVELMSQKEDLFWTDALLTNVEDSLRDLDHTESVFLKLSTDKSLDEAAKIFFGDLRRNYQETRATIQKGPKAERRPQARGTQVRPLLVSDESGQLDRLAANVVLRSLELNELAYTDVADDGSLYFNLKVESVPAGANVFLRRRGDTYKQQPEQTNTTIDNLVRAVWQVRFELQGYQPYEVEHNPFTDPNNAINVVLKK